MVCIYVNQWKCSELPNWFNTTNGEVDAQNGNNGWFVGVTGPGEFTVTLSSADWTHQPLVLIIK